MSYAKLRGKIREVYGSEKLFANAMGISTSTVSLKLNEKGSWTVDEMVKALELLDIEQSNANEYFFVK